jgi:hypothetical protein
MRVSFDLIPSHDPILSAMVVVSSPLPSTYRISKSGKAHLVNALEHEVFYGITVVIEPPHFSNKFATNHRTNLSKI